MNRYRIYFNKQFENDYFLNYEENDINFKQL